jgi:hypothetical protein
VDVTDVDQSLLREVSSNDLQTFWRKNITSRTVLLMYTGHSQKLEFFTVL